MANDGDSGMKPQRRVGGIPLRAFVPNAVTAMALCCGLSSVRAALEALNLAANGGTASYCDCTTKELQAKLSPEVFAQVAKRQPGSDPETLLDVMAAADKACVKP